MCKIGLQLLSSASVKSSAYSIWALQHLWNGTANPAYAHMGGMLSSAKQKHTFPKVNTRVYINGN